MMAAGEDELSLPGFDSLVQTARSLGMKVALREPATAVPDTTDSLGSRLDPCLVELLRTRADGGRIGDLFLYSCCGGPNDLVELNQSARTLDDDEPRARDIVELAQVGLQATYLATFPAGAADGPDPVLWVDRNEGLLALPLASSVDRALGLYGRYLALLAERHGSREAGAAAVLLPWDISELVSEDGALRDLVASGAFDSIVDRENPDVERWLTVLLP